MHRTVVPGFHPVPPFPKLSSLNGQQHYQLLKVLCAQNPDILPGEFIGRPSKQDHRIFEVLFLNYSLLHYLEGTAFKLCFTLNAIVCLVDLTSLTHFQGLNNSNLPFYPKL